MAQADQIQFDKMVRSAAALSPGLRIVILWTPAHIGTFGNEFADGAAKATRRLPPPPSVPVSQTRNQHLYSRAPAFPMEGRYTWWRSSRNRRHPALPHTTLPILLLSVPCGHYHPLAAPYRLLVSQCARVHIGSRT